MFTIQTIRDRNGFFLVSYVCVLFILSAIGWMLARSFIHSFQWKHRTDLNIAATRELNFQLYRLLDAPWNSDVLGSGSHIDETLPNIQWEISSPSPRLKKVTLSMVLPVPSQPIVRVTGYKFYDY